MASTLILQAMIHTPFDELASRTQMLAGKADEEQIDERALSKLRWRCRRGMLENDLFIERFFTQYANRLTLGQARGLGDLMDFGDNDLLDLLLKRKEPPPETSSKQLRDVLQILREV